MQLTLSLKAPDGFNPWNRNAISSVSRFAFKLNFVPLHTGAVRHAVALAKLEGLLRNLTDALVLSGHARVSSSAAVASFASNVAALATKRLLTDRPNSQTGQRGASGHSRKPLARNLKDAFAVARGEIAAVAAPPALTAAVCGLRSTDYYGGCGLPSKLTGKISKLMAEVERMRGIVRQLQQPPGGVKKQPGGVSRDVRRDGAAAATSQAAAAEAAAAGAGAAAGIIAARRLDYRAEERKRESVD
jgi:hypothetical protein